MEIIEEYINQGITAEICFSQKFAETPRNILLVSTIHDGVNSDKFLKKVKALEAIINN